MYPQVHEMDLLPKHMCHRCTYKLEEFYKFYADCLKTDADLKSQLSWMGKDVPTERVGIPMVHIENVKIKIEPRDYDAYDMSPMVDNADYINSMSSVTFQPNDIPYAAYASCRCCCDKMDQSNQAVPTNYENTISTCNRRVIDVEACNNNRTNKSQAAKKQQQQQQSSTISVNENCKDSRSNKPTSFSSNHPGGARVKFNAKKDVFRSPIVRNLRPRKGSVDYVGSKRKSPGISTSRSTKPKAAASPLQTRVKVEKLDNLEGRILRPRTGTIDYCMSTRKRSKSTDKNQRSQDEEYPATKYTVRNIANKLKLPSREVSKLTKDRIKMMVKEEQLSDLDELLSPAMLPKDRKAVKIEALPNGHLVDFQNDRINGNMLNCAQPTTDFSATYALKSPKSVSKGKLKSGKMSSSPTAATITYSPKFLRSHDSYLRSGKIKKFDDAKASARKLQRNLRNVADRVSTTTGRNLMATIPGVVGAKNISASIKLTDSNVKRYCEDCNVSFLNKELFKLHACYH